ncbi:MAG: hypothetical protein JJU28_00095 [Cyclobacteriaceae bacterium]|nr:hypothetical protein [Cyclobacteriaceae bacterium]
MKLVDFVILFRQRELNERVFSWSMLIGTFFALGITLNGMVYSLPPFIFIINFIMTLVAAILFILSLYKRWQLLAKWIFFPMAVVAIALAWMGNTGYLSSNSLVFLLAYTLFLVVVNHRIYIYFIGYLGYFIIFTFLNYYDFYHMSHPEIDPEFYKTDIKIKFVVWVLGALGVTFLIFMVKDAFYREQQKLSISNLKLHKASNELIQINRELQTQSEELTAQRDQLFEKNQIIERQRQMLEFHNIDLTEVVEARTRDLQLINLELLQQNRRLEEFNYVLAHKLRGPLASIKGLRNLENIKAISQEQYSRLLDKETYELEKITNDLQQILEMRNADFAITPCNLNELFQDALQRVDPFFKREEIDLIIDTSHSVLPLFRNRLINILVELLKNAHQFKSQLRPLHIQIRMFVNTAGLNIVISDNGSGFDAVHYDEKLFKMYQVFHRNYSGRGLGLYLAHMEVAFLGGTIVLWSEPERGTVVRVQCPVKQYAGPAL